MKAVFNILDFFMVKKKEMSKRQIQPAAVRLALALGQALITKQFNEKAKLKNPSDIFMENIKRDICTQLNLRLPVYLFI